MLTQRVNSPVIFGHPFCIPGTTPFLQAVPHNQIQALNTTKLNVIYASMQVSLQETFKITHRIRNLPGCSWCPAAHGFNHQILRHAGCIAAKICRQITPAVEQMWCHDLGVCKKNQWVPWMMVCLPSSFSLLQLGGSQMWRSGQRAVDCRSRGNKRKLREHPLNNTKWRSRNAKKSLR